MKKLNKKKNYWTNKTKYKIKNLHYIYTLYIYIIYMYIFTV